MRARAYSDPRHGKRGSDASRGSHAIQALPLEFEGRIAVLGFREGVTAFLEKRGKMIEND
jgi:hypothetical protein